MLAKHKAWVIGDERLPSLERQNGETEIETFLKDDSLSVYSCQFNGLIISGTFDVWTPMALLTVDKIEQLRHQLEACTNHQTASALKVAIARLESQLQPSAPTEPETQLTDEILQPLIAQGSIKVYHPSR